MWSALPWHCDQQLQELTNDHITAMPSVDAMEALMAVAPMVARDIFLMLSPYRFACCH